MNKLQSLFVALILGMMFNFGLPMLLSDFTVGFDSPLGYVTIFDPSGMFGAYNIAIGVVFGAIIMYVMVTEIRRRK